MVRGRNTARVDPSVAKDKIPHAMLSTFLSLEDRSDWPHIIIEASIPTPDPLEINMDKSIGDTSSKLATTDFHTPGSRAASVASINNNEGGDGNVMENLSTISSLNEDEFEFDSEAIMPLWMMPC